MKLSKIQFHQHLNIRPGVEFRENQRRIKQGRKRHVSSVTICAILD